MTNEEIESKQTECAATDITPKLITKDYAATQYKSLENILKASFYEIGKDGERGALRGMPMHITIAVMKLKNIFKPCVTPSLELSDVVSEQWNTLDKSKKELSQEKDADNTEAISFNANIDSQKKELEDKLSSYVKELIESPSYDRIPISFFSKFEIVPSIKPINPLISNNDLLVMFWDDFCEL